MARWNETMTPEEAAQYLRVHPSTVYRNLRSGRLPGAKVGQQWRISKAVLDRYLATREAVSVNDEPTVEELEESKRAWLNYLAGRDPGRSLDELLDELEARR